MTKNQNVPIMIIYGEDDKIVAPVDASWTFNQNKMGMEADETIEDDLKHYIKKNMTQGGHISFFVGKNMDYIDNIVETINNEKFTPNYDTGEEREYLQISLVVDIILIVTNIILNITLVYFTYLVLKITKCTNGKINLLMLFMNLTLISDLVLKIHVIADNINRTELR